jgi:hypothetical protein
MAIGDCQHRLAGYALLTATRTARSGPMSAFAATADIGGGDRRGLSAFGRQGPVEGVRNCRDRATAPNEDICCFKLPHCNAERSAAIRPEP